MGERQVSDWKPTKGRKLEASEWKPTKGVRVEGPDAGSPPAAAPATEMGLWDHINRAAANQIQGLSFNTAHRWAPEVMAGIDELAEVLEPLGIGDRKDFGQRVREQRKSWARNIDPAMAAAGAMPAMIVAGAARPTLNTLGGLLTSNALGAVGEVDRKGTRLLSPEGATEAGLMTAMGTALPYGLRGLGWIGRQAMETMEPVGRMLRDVVRGGYVQPTPEAQRLMAEGVELTLGQMHPSSPIGRFEEIAANNALGGPLAKTRAESATAARDVLLRRAAAPGAEPPTAGAPVSEQVRQLKAGYDKLYDDALEGVRISPDLDLGNGVRRGLFTDPSLVGAAKTKGLFELAVDGTKDAPASVKRRALAWLADVAETRGLTPYKSGPDAGDVDARSIQRLRTSVGDELRSLGEEGEDRFFRKIYERAHESLTEILHSRLPPAKAATLKDVDAKYSDYLAVKNAASGKVAHRNEGEFTADQLLDAIWRASGVTPGLSRAALDVRAVLSPTYPKTGALPGAASAILEGKYIGPLWAKMANADPRFRSHALGMSQAPMPLRVLLGLGEAAIGVGSKLGASVTHPSLASMSPAVRTLTELLSPAPALPAAAERNLPSWAVAP